jgi:hypothetical protein
MNESNRNKKPEPPREEGFFRATAKLPMNSPSSLPQGSEAQQAGQPEEGAKKLKVAA